MASLARLAAHPAAAMRRSMPAITLALAAAAACTAGAQPFARGDALSRTALGAPFPSCAAGSGQTALNDMLSADGVAAVVVDKSFVN